MKIQAQFSQMPDTSIQHRFPKRALGPLAFLPCPARDHSHLLARVAGSAGSALRRRLLQREYPLWPFLVGEQLQRGTTTRHSATQRSLLMIPAVTIQRVGAFALNSNTKGDFNTAAGYNALFRDWTGSANTAFGYFALYSNTLAVVNTAIGSYALRSNTTGSDNTAVGSGALGQQHHGSRQHCYRCRGARFQHHREQQHGHGR